MPLKRYMPSRESIKEEFSRELRYKLRSGKRSPRIHQSVPDNSQPWLENPRTVAEWLYIAQCVQALEDKWGPKTQN